MGDIADAGEIDRRILRSRVLEELFALVGTDVTEDAAI